MRFVEKKEFEKALAIVEEAINSGQVRFGHHDNTAAITEAVFVAEGGETATSKQLTFVSPFVAAQTQLAKVRNMLKNTQEISSQTTKALEALEKTERELAKLVPTLKE